MLVGIDNPHDSSLLTSKLFKSIHSHEKGADQQMEESDEIQRRMHDRSKLNFSNDPYESIDYSQGPQNNLPPKGFGVGGVVGGNSRIEIELNESDRKMRAEQEQLLKRQPESAVSLASSIAPNSSYYPGSGQRQDFISSKNSQNMSKLAGFTFDVEVKKNKELPLKQKKSSLSKETTSKDQTSSFEPGKQTQKKVYKKRKPGKKRSFSKKQRGSKMIKMQEYRIQTPQDGMNRSVSPFNTLTNPSFYEQNPRAASTSPLGVSAGGGNMMVYRGKVPLAFGSKLHSPPQDSDIQRAETPDLNIDIFPEMKGDLIQTGAFNSPGTQEDEEANDSHFRSIEQNQMSLRNSFDLGIQGKKISLSPPKQSSPSSKAPVEKEKITESEMNETPDKLYSQSARASPSKEVETPIQGSTKKSIISKYQQKMISSSSVKHPRLGSSPLDRVSSKQEKSIYKSEITEFNSNLSSEVQQKQRELLIQSSIGRRGDTEEFLSKITEMQQMMTQESGNYSPVLQRRLSPLKLIGQQSPRIPSRGQQIELQSYEKSPLKTPTSQAHFTLAPSLLYDSEVLKNEINSGNIEQMLQIGQDILKRGVTQLKNSQSAPVSPPTQFKSGLSSAHHQKQQSLKVPISLSSVQLVTVEELETENLQVTQLTKTERESNTIKKILSTLDYKASEERKSKGVKGQELRRARVPPQKKRPFIGTKNQPAPVPPHQLSPYSSKYGRITRRSAGTWCQIPSKILDMARSTPKKNPWNFFSLGADDWGQILKQETEESEKLEEERPDFKLKKKKSNGPRSKKSDLSGRQPLTKQRTIAIKMKTISYEEVDSLNTSKEIPRRKLEKTPSTKGIFKSRVSSAAADTVHSFMITGDTSHAFKPKTQPSQLRDLVPNAEITQEGEALGQNEPIKVYLETKRKSQHLSATSITKLLMPRLSVGPSRTKSTQQLGNLVKPEVVKEEPLQEAIVSSRAAQRKSVT